MKQFMTLSAMVLSAACLTVNTQSFAADGLNDMANGVKEVGNGVMKTTKGAATTTIEAAKSVGKGVSNGADKLKSWGSSEKSKHKSKHKHGHHKSTKNTQSQTTSKEAPATNGSGLPDNATVVPAASESQY